MKKKPPGESHWAEKLENKFYPQSPGENISLSLIIPTYNDSSSIRATLTNIEQQHYTPLEIIVIDAGSTDHTLEIINIYTPLVSRIYSVTTFNIPEMMNRAISLASGQYIAFLFPGSFYISQKTLQTFSLFVQQNYFPDVVYSGTLLREVNREPRFFNFPFDPALLVKGKQPAAIPSCWFRADLFEKIGKFDPSYQIRTNFEFFCRFAKAHMHIAFIDRILVDFDYGSFTREKFLVYAGDTWRILYRHYGFVKALAWFISINHLMIVKGLWRSFKYRIFGKS